MGDSFTPLPFLDVANILFLFQFPSMCERIKLSMKDWYVFSLLLYNNVFYIVS